MKVVLVSGEKVWSKQQRELFHLASKKKIYKKHLPSNDKPKSMTKNGPYYEYWNGEIGIFAHDRCTRPQLWVWKWSVNIISRILILFSAQKYIIYLGFLKYILHNLKFLKTQIHFEFNPSIWGRNFEILPVSSCDEDRITGQVDQVKWIRVKGVLLWWLCGR